MLLLEFKPEGSIFNPVDSVNNSNTDQQIEIIYVMDNVTKESKKVRILRDPTKYLNPILNNLTDKDIYSEKKDSNGIPLLNRIEKYPDLPEDIFIPVEYIIQKEHEVNLNTLYVNKKGEYINSKTNNYLTLSIDNNFYKNINTTINNLSVNIRSHIPESFTFLFIPKEKTNIYCFVNHKDHIRDNNNLSNLEFVTPATNANKEDGYCSLTSENKLMEYIAYDENGKEIFRINRYNTCGYNINSITQAIRIKNGIFKNYIWKKATLSKKEITLNKLGYTWNPSDYLWYSHWKYSDMYVCKEGFIFYKGKILCSESRGYIFINLGNNSGIGANRIIAEFLLGRNLKSNEIVDHINTNTLDNSFENLRVTDAKGNMNNTLTRSKFTERLILADLYGNFITCNFPKELSKLVKRKKSGTIDLTSSSIIQNKYICIKIGDKEDLLKKMRKVIYVYKNNKLIDAISHNNFVIYLKDKLPYSRSRIQYYINNKLPIIIKDDIYTFKFGESAVNEMIKLGHVNAYKYIPEEIQQDLQSIINYSKYKHLIVPIETVLNYKNPRNISIKEYDFMGNLKNQYDSISSSENYNMAYKVIIGECFSGYDLIWCKIGNEEEIKEKLKYIYYKYDEDGNILDADLALSRLFHIKTNKILNKENQKEYNKCKDYLNTGVKSPNGYYYRQGIEPIENDSTNTDLILKRSVLKWKPKKERKRRKK